MKEITEASEIFLRFKQGAGAKSVADLAQVLGVAPQSIYNAQANGKIPGSWFRRIADLNNISIDWLTYGEGSMVRGEEVQNLPPNQDIDREVLLEVVETLEDFLQDSKKNLPPKAKAELVYQLYQLVIEEESGTRCQPIRMFRLIQNAMAANE